MRMTYIAAMAMAVLILPSIAQAQDPAAGAATGVAAGAGVGSAVGGPVGAAVGDTVGAGASEDADRRRTEESVIIEQRDPTLLGPNCVTDAAGTTVCEEIRR